MIKALYILNTNYDLLIKRTFKTQNDFKSIASALKNHNDSNFIDLYDSILVHKTFEDTIFCFEIKEENEMYILELIDIFASAVERMVDSFNHKSIVYHFDNIYFLIDNFIIDGLVFNIDPSDNTGLSEAY